MIRTVLAPNPGPMTLTGTNSYVVRRGNAALVIDPGPDNPDHLDAVIAAAGGTPITALVATHHHGDHTDGIADLVSRTGATQLDPTSPGDRHTLSTWGVEVIATPGHTSDSVCLLVQTDPPTLLTGDTVLGIGPTMVDDLGGYLASLDRIFALIDTHAITRLLPGHGPVSTSPLALVRALRQYRLDRLEQVRQATVGGATTAEEVVALVYPDLADDLRPAALASAAAQLAYLRGPTGTHQASLAPRT